MISILLRLAVIALLVYAGVALWYGRVEDRLQRQEPVKQEERAATPVQEEKQPAPAGNDYQIILTRNIFKAALLNQEVDRVDHLKLMWKIWRKPNCAWCCLVR